MALFVLLHCALILDGAASFLFLPPGGQGSSSILGAYGVLSGAHNHYPFFAPSVRNSIFATLRAREHGVELFERTDREWHPEARQRIGTAIWRLVGVASYDDLARALGTDFLERHRCVKEVEISFVVHRSPRRREYLEGLGGTDEVVYKGIANHSLPPECRLL
jgi:hypothetical protein